jgi:integrase
MPLSDASIRSALPSEKPRKMADSGGLYLLVNPSGSRWWRFDYRHHGKRKTLSMGTYPDTGLKDARTRRDAARKLLSDGVDPGVARKASKLASASGALNNFAVIAAEWLSLQKARMAVSTFEKAEWTFKELVNPWIGTRPIAEIDAPELLNLLRKIEKRGAHETAHRTKQRCGQVFRYAIATSRAKHDPSGDLRGALAPVVSKSRAALTEPSKIRQLLLAIAKYDGSKITKAALLFSPYVFVRPGELRNAEWSEMDLVAGIWRIPAARMKMREEHVVPLAPQSISILSELMEITGRGQFVFPGYRGNARTMSENTINAALRYMGFDKETMTGHGFRAMASSRLNEMGWSPDIIERQLAHTERNKVRAAYNRAQYLAERRQMMFAWANYLDALRDANSDLDGVL